MVRFLFVYLFVFLSFSVCAQDNFWEEDFGTDAACGINDADGFTTLNGPWSVEAVGANGVESHNWYVGPREAGMPIEQCGNSCLIDPELEDNTLYVCSEALNTTNGAVFQNGIGSETNLRVASPIISFVGISDSMAVKLKYIYSGHSNSLCVLEYHNGTDWNDLWVVQETIGACGDAGEWSDIVIPLPGDVSNNPNVRFGFRWENAGPEEMPAPELSFALDKIECSCKSFLEADVDYSNPFDNDQSPNPLLIFDESDCSNTYSETYFLSEWAAEIFDIPGGAIVLSCTANVNDYCGLGAVNLMVDPPGCVSQPVGLNIEPENPEVYGPEVIVDWAAFDFIDFEVCEGGCLDFTFYPGVYPYFGTPEYDIDLPPGATLQNMNWNDWDGNYVGQVCFEFPGTYNLTGNGSFCGIASEEGESGIITVLPADLSPEITVSESEICPGGCVEFSIEEIPDADVQWNFEGGTPSVSYAQQSGLICFDEQGTYDISLSINSPGGCGFGEIEEGYTVIDCGEPPVAAFSASSTTVCVGECIDFTDESSGTNNDTWDWVFSGATPITSEDQNPTGVCYNSTGIFAVTLGVSNMMGSDILYLSEMIEVIECPMPSAAFSASATEICTGECIDFTDESSGPDINGWSWTFDGATIGNSDEENPAGICYDTPGTYSVTLLVSNPNGIDEVTESTMIVVDPCYPDPEPIFTVDVTNICPGECVNFTNQSTVTGDTEWNWNFEGADISSSNDENPADICYTTPGVYDVTLTVSDEGGTESLTQSNLIIVEECPEPNALFSVSDSVICPGECVQLNNMSSGIVTGYTWTFPEGVVGDTTAINPELCFNQAGTYSISLNAFNDDGETSDFTLEQAVVVDPCLPELAIAVSEDRICVGDCVSFTNITESVSTNWQWTFPGAVNNTSQTENPPEVCYHTPGVYDVALQSEFAGIIVDSTFSQYIHVIDSCGPVANFDYTPILCLGQCYNFENTSSGGTEFFWVFEGAINPISEEESPTEICYLDETGLFNVTLTVVDEFGSSTSITQQVSVVTPPNLNAGPDRTIIQGTTTVLSATAGSGTGEFIWQPYEEVVCFDCPTTSTVPLNETTTFIVYYEESGGCQITDTVTVFVEESLNFGVPDSFSPNGDGVNDILYVRGSNITALDLMIYNRYGQQVFRTTNQLEGWDGTLNGRELDAGVFGYSLEVRQRDVGRKIVKGDVNLVR